MLRELAGRHGFRMGLPGEAVDGHTLDTRRVVGASMSSSAIRDCADGSMAALRAYDLRNASDQRVIRHTTCTMQVTW